MWSPCENWRAKIESKLHGSFVIEQARAIPIVVDGVIGLSHGNGHIIAGYLEAFSPPFPPYT
jgi:hypothetical protein